MKLTTQHRKSFVYDVMKDVPNIDFGEKVRVLIQNDAIRLLPLLISRIHDNNELRHYIAVKDIYLYNWHQRINVVNGEEYVASEIVLTEVKRLRKLHDEQEETTRLLRNNLYQISCSCSTLNKLKETLPEFIEYMPTDKVTVSNRSVPVVINMVEAFVNAGWPKKEAE
jgi:hypothetical protein